MRRRILYNIVKNNFFVKMPRFTEEYVQCFDQEANDLVGQAIHDALTQSKGLMISKFGFFELHSLCSLIHIQERGGTFSKLWEAFHGGRDVFPDQCLNHLCYNAGFFPADVKFAYRWKDLVLSDIPDIDILGSYLVEEKYLDKDLSHCKKINLEGYYAPFLWKNPWSKEMKGKKILVVHPFTDSIQIQYEKRRDLFNDPEVLPEFSELYLIKAVQSIAGCKTEFSDWFQALDYMKAKMDTFDYDVALIGCGAYGMNLAAHAKRQGKVAIHLAGWTQMLFGIYGNRWIKDQPQYARFINENWIRPLENEKPQGVDRIENGCYW